MGKKKTFSKFNKKKPTKNFSKIPSFYTGRVLVNINVMKVNFIANVGLSGKTLLADT